LRRQPRKKRIEHDERFLELWKDADLGIVEVKVADENVQYISVEKRKSPFLPKIYSYLSLPRINQ
jgi:hypothetical protein